MKNELPLILPIVPGREAEEEEDDDELHARAPRQRTPQRPDDGDDRDARRRAIQRDRRDEAEHDLEEDAGGDQQDARRRGASDRRLTAASFMAQV